MDLPAGASEISLENVLAQGDGFVCFTSSFRHRCFQGMYAVAVGPYPGARCEDRATLWRIRVPAAEKIMSQHYARDSVPSLTESVLMEILSQLREGQPLNSPIKPKVTPSEFFSSSPRVFRPEECSA